MDQAGDTEDGLPFPEEFFGMASDPHLVGLVWRFYYDILNDLWVPGKRPSDASGRHQGLNPTRPGSNSPKIGLRRLEILSKKK